VQLPFPGGTFDFATAFMSFMDIPETAGVLAEAYRILKPGGKLALIWNQRRMEQPFQQAYEALLRALAPEYGKVNHMNLDDDDIAQFYNPGQMQVSHFDNNQQFDFDGLTGRLKSSSYCPNENTPEYARLIDELSRLFDRHAVDGRLVFEYDTRLYLGPIAR
jgi:SAM-dependent methyltransferase